MSYLTAIKIRLYPNHVQADQLNKTFGCCRFLYNQMLNEHKLIYNRLKDDKEKLYAYKYRTEKEYKALFPFLHEVDSVALQSAREHLQLAYATFFSKYERSQDAYHQALCRIPAIQVAQIQSIVYDENDEQQYQN